MLRFILNDPYNLRESPSGHTINVSISFSLSLLPSHSLTFHYMRKNMSVQKIGVEASKIGEQKAKKKKDVEKV